MGVSDSFFFFLCPFGFTVCSALGAQGSEATFSSELAGVTGDPASGEGLQSLQSDDEELEIDEELSGGDNENVSLHGTTKTKSFVLDLDFIPLQMLFTLGGSSYVTAFYL